ncbi:MAG: hypothetical protein M4579_003063 [Chaenotheca gracillima]|nr:MAG: hypothetical protein M4579_003063 [Chaenotheca gracillima]
MAASMETARPQILLLSLQRKDFFDEMYSKLLEDLLSKATVQRVSKSTTALKYLSENTPHAILVTDPAITKSKYRDVLTQVISYARRGGRVVIAGHFSSFVLPLDLDRFFRVDWDLEWSKGEYQRTTVHLNRDVPQVSKEGLALAYSQKAVFLKGVVQSARLYSPSSDSITESHVFAPGPIEDLTETAVVFSAVGDGWLGYMGDVNAEDASQPVVVAMCGL